MQATIQCLRYLGGRKIFLIFLPGTRGPAGLCRPCPRRRYATKLVSSFGPGCTGVRMNRARTVADIRDPSIRRRTRSFRSRDGSERRSRTRSARRSRARSGRARTAGRTAGPRIPACTSRCPSRDRTSTCAPPSTGTSADSRDRTCR